MKIGVFSPYLDILGGGERYILTVADYLSQRGDEVNIFWDDDRLKNRVKERLGVNLNKTRFVEDIFSSRKNLLQKWLVTKNYDLFFYLSDGSIPFLFGKKNFLFFMVPFTGVNGRSFLNKIKLRGFHQVVTISQFNKNFIDKEYGVESKIIYPPVDVGRFRSEKKENLIISVGRFQKTIEQRGLVRPLHSKKQEILIETFRRMNDEGLKKWRLVLIGGIKGSKEYLDDLKKLAKAYPIEIKTNISLIELKKYYRKAKIYWHAAGFGEDEEKHPERMEHFGITTVEGMAAGVVPVVIDKGGQPEIVKHGTNGLLWETKSELMKYTLQLIKSTSKWGKLSKQAIKDSQKFSRKNFYRKIDELIKD